MPTVTRRFGKIEVQREICLSTVNSRASKIYLLRMQGLDDIASRFTDSLAVDVLSVADGSHAWQRLAAVVEELLK